ncbi:MAG: aminopeptidase N [Corynebacterium sp.]|uniref:aminopeptidase N n=1 Tax=Corynebacterium sp. TaxID=1720 RepID=UPI0026DB5D3F|nr:aminopeptidase N [Corynebacterium sp.]MDO5030704.1 aminopeptidase N [Corynebacterium sp.]
MTSKNLTRNEAIARAELLRVNHYDIDLDLTTAPVDAPHSAPTFASKTTISLTAKSAGSTFVDLRDAHVKSVTIDGVDATKAARYNSDTGINLDLTEGDHIVVIDADCRYTNNGQGIHRFQDPADGETYLYSQFETADAKRVFACFDQPDLKATYSIHVVAPKGWKVISNSVAKTGTTTDAHGNDADTFDFSVDVPLSTYLVAVCAGPWYEVTDTWTGMIAPHPETPVEHQPDGEMTIPLGLYCRKSIAEHLDADTLFKETKEGFDFYAKHFGEPYAFGKYDQVFCPEYNMGAMENAGCVTIRDEYVFRSKPTAYLYERRNDTILHEMAHMWFGDLVTMKWWDDLWLNESFATWSAAAAQMEVSDFSSAWTAFANVEKAWAYKQDQLPSTHPIAADASDIDTVEQNFDGITYAKGASTLKQLAAYVGQDAFLAGARLHFARHRFGNATFDDLLEALSEASGRDLSGWADQWLTTTGITTLAPDFRVSAGKYTSFAVTQDGAQPGAGELRDHRIAVGIYNLRGTGDDAVLERTKRVEIDVRGARTEVPELLDTPIGDVVIVNDDDLTYSMIRLDESSLSTVIDHIGAFTDSMPRTLCWSATWQMVRAGQMRARDFVELVLRGIPGEDKLSVLERIIAQAISAVNVYADPQWAEATGRDLLAKGLLEYAQKETDADRALIFVNALCSVGSSESDVLDALRAVYNNDADKAGFQAVTVDTDMQWRALKALVAAGVEGEDAIVAMEKTDNSALGTQAAIAARASVPTLANKARVWAEATVSGDEAPSNLVIRHLLMGFNAPGAGKVLATALDDDTRAAISADASAASLADHFFAVANSWWQDFSSETAQTLLEGLYPTWEITETAVAAAQRLLDSDQTAAPVKRIISEQQFLMKLALRAREFDAQ